MYGMEISVGYCYWWGGDVTDGVVMGCDVTDGVVMLLVESRLNQLRVLKPILTLF